MFELVLCTLIWGAAFIAQKAGSEHFGPFTVMYVGHDIGSGV